jgi:hypothetical protein
MDTSDKGELLVIGALLADTVYQNTGAVYVFEKQPDDTYIQIQKIVPSDVIAGDVLGHGVMISSDGTMIIIEGYLSDSAGSNTGAVYVFIRDEDGAYKQAQKIVQTNNVDNDKFGISCLSTDKSTLVVSSFNKNSNTGICYVFKWSLVKHKFVEVQQLIGHDTVAGSYFGSTVCISPDLSTILVTSLIDPANNSNSTVYVFKKNLTGLYEEKYKIQNLVSPYSFFGTSIGTDTTGDLIAIGEITGVINSVKSGKVSIYRLDLSTDSYQKFQELPSQPIPVNSYFGNMLQMSDDANHLVVAAGSPDTAMAYVYKRNNDDLFELKQTIDSGSGSFVFYSGYSVAISNDNSILIGAYRDTELGIDAGAVFVYK